MGNVSRLIELKNAKRRADQGEPADAA